MDLSMGDRGARTRSGIALALLAALLFGVATPFIQRFGAGVGAFSTAGLLYAGAALASLGGRSGREAPVRREHLPRIGLVALLGAVLAPVSLAWGLQHTQATTASLLLNLEAAFTVVLARALYAEPVGPRVAAAVACMLAGSTILVAGAGADGHGLAGLGALAVALAALGWAADSALTRPLADLDPASVVLRKGTLGALLSGAVGALAREKAPGAVAALALLACGALGYGASLRLYLGAQRRIGAARTASIFALAPFAGAATAWVSGDRGREGAELAAAALFGLAVYLHLGERHGHAHHHDATEHEHAHRHDDGHHTHAHVPPFMGEHSHAHRHEAMDHAHAHGPDLHHQHPHR